MTKSKAKTRLEDPSINLEHSETWTARLNDIRRDEKTDHSHAQSVDGQVRTDNSFKSDFGYQFTRDRVTKLNPDQPLSGDLYALRVRDEIIGQLAVAGGDSQQGDHLNIVAMIVDRLSAHLERLRLAEQREQALAETEVLYSVSARLSTAQSLEEALEAVSDPAQKTGAHESRLYLINLDERGLADGVTLTSTWTSKNGAQPVSSGRIYRIKENPAFWQILKEPNRPLLIENIRTSPFLDDPSRNLFLGNGARTVAILPMTISGRWVGVIVVYWALERDFTGQEERLYATLSRQAAVVINNRILLEQTYKRAQELQTVAQVSIAASTILDPIELLQSVVDLTKTSFHLNHVQVYTFHEKDGLFKVAASSDGADPRPPEHSRITRLEVSSSVLRAGARRRSVVINDIQRVTGSLQNSYFPGTRSEISIPMIIGERLLGVFNVQDSMPNRFSQEDVRIFTTLASQVAVAFQNAELYAEQTATVERLRELDHLKSTFLANMSHELRTPLNSILGFSDVLLLGLDGELNEMMQNDVHLIEKNGKHLLSLINDVLDMAKIEAGKMNLSFERFRVGELMEETLDITSSLAREKNLALQILPNSELDVEIRADRIRLRQVFINIISNAVKFTERGGVYIRIERLENTVQISFRDTGIGIPKNMLESVFQSFSQVDTSTTRKAGGTGLGLPISRRLIEMHGGQMWAESSAAGEGSTFYVTLPLETESEDQAL